MKPSVRPVCSRDCGSGGSGISGVAGVPGVPGVPVSGIVGAGRVCGWYKIVPSLTEVTNVSLSSA